MPGSGKIDGSLPGLKPFDLETLFHHAKAWCFHLQGLKPFGNLKRLQQV
jgi:hypothetical protein